MPRPRRRQNDAALDKRLLDKTDAILKKPTAAKIAAGRVVGTFSRTAKGFGFVRLPKTAAAEDKELEDIYIPANYAGDASTGDTVVVQVSKRRGGEPGVRGEIVEILERQSNEFVGTYFESRGTGYVQVDGTLFAQPIAVGDPGAKNAQPDDKVVIEMVHFPSPLHDGEGVITEVLGPRGKPGVDTLSIIREYNLVEPVRRRSAGRRAAAGRGVSRSGPRGPRGLYEDDDRHHRSRRRPRFRRRDFARTA